VRALFPCRCPSPYRSAAGSREHSDLRSGYYFYFCNAFGPQLYSGPESSPTLLTGNFSLADAENTEYFLAGTGTLNATSVPEPSALSLLAIGLAIFALRKQ
jgi:PEP-CTERM motif-containing protein